MTVYGIERISDSDLLTEVQRRRLAWTTDRDALREAPLHAIAAELLWRASKPTTSRPWRPFYLTHGEALVLARHAVDNALHEAHDRGEMVTADARGCEMLGGAALLVLEKIEPGRWRVEITVVSHGRSPDVVVTEREPASEVVP